MYEESYKLGVELAAKQFGLDLNTALVKKAAEDIVENSFEEQQLYSRAGANVLALTGDTNSPQYRSLCKCASFNRLLSKESYNMFIQPVKDAFIKQAGIGAAIAGGLSKTVGTSATVLTALIALTGAGLGAAAWGANRAATTDQAKTEAKFKQAKKYRQLAQEIRNNIA
jgi:hypothetical protein